MFGQKNSTGLDGVERLCTNIRRCPEGRSLFGPGFPIGAGSIPVGTRLSMESLVCYTFVEQMAAGTVARPGKCGYSCGVLAGKVAPCGQHKRQKKAGRRCVCRPCHLRNKGISKSPVSRCLPSYQNHHGNFPRKLSIASPSTFFVRLSLRWKWSAAPISGCSIPSVKP